MMDTVLNLGLNDDSVGGPREADAQRALRVRLVPPLRADVRQDRARHRRRQVRDALDRAARRRRASPPTPSCRPRTCTELVETFKAIVLRRGRRRVPAGSAGAARATRSKRCSSRGTATARAIYREMEKIPDDLGTAVNVQTMVFGNKGDDSGTGVAFTRDPVDRREPALRRLPRERAGRGRRRRHPRHRAARRDGATTSPSRTPQLLDVMQLLEQHYRDMCDIEFTIEQGRCSCSRRASASAPRRPRCAWPSRWRARGSSTSARRCCASQPDAARPAPAPAVRPDGEVRRDREGPQRVAGRRGRQGVLHAPTTPRRTTPAGEARHPRAPRDVARRPPRHDRGRGHPHVARRAGEPRRASWRAGWASPRCAARPSSTSTSPAAASPSNGVTVREGDVISINGTTGEVVVGAVPRGHARSRPGAFDDRARVGRRAPRARRCARTPTCPRTRKVARRSAPRASGCAAPSTCSSATACRSCSASSSPPTTPRSAPRSRSCAQAAALRLRGHPRGDGRAARHHPAARPAAARVPPRHRGAAGQARRSGELDDEGRVLLAAAQQWREANPMLGTRGVPPRHPQARPVPHAGRRRSSRPRSRASTRAATRTSRS